MNNIRKIEIIHCFQACNDFYFVFHITNLDTLQFYWKLTKWIDLKKNKTKK